MVKIVLDSLKLFNFEIQKCGQILSAHIKPYFLMLAIMLDYASCE